MSKKFKLSAEQIAPIAIGYGGCIASDRITVDGLPVRFFYRTEPHNELDSGWSFLSGTEDDAYMNDASNHGVYDVNTIANYDPSIIAHLEAPVGSAFEKLPDAAQFVEVSDWSPED
jgi:hypothetical protein